LDPVAGLAAVGIVGISQLGGLRHGDGSDVERFGGRYLGGPTTMADRADSRFPSAGVAELGEHLVGVRKMCADVPYVHVGVDVAKPGSVAAHPGAAIGELSFDPS